MIIVTIQINQLFEILVDTKFFQQLLPLLIHAQKSEPRDNLTSHRLVKSRLCKPTLPGRCTYLLVKLGALRDLACLFERLLLSQPWWLQVLAKGRYLRLASNFVLGVLHSGTVLGPSGLFIFVHYILYLTLEQLLNALHKGTLKLKQLVILLIERYTQKLNQLFFTWKHLSTSFVVN
jgi:hypothetical protein